MSSCIHWLHRITSWYFTRNTLPYWCILALDCTIILASAFLVYLIRFGMMALLQNVGLLFLLWAIYLIPYLVMFRAFRTYSGIIRYSSFVDLQRVGIAMLTATFGVWLIYRFIPWEIQSELYTTGALIIIAVISTGAMWGVRVLVKYVYNFSCGNLHAEKVGIYGVGGSHSIARSLLYSDDSSYVLDCFITADSGFDGRTLMGRPVFIKDHNLIKILLRRRVGTLMISPREQDVFRTDDELVNALIESGIRIQMLPATQQWDRDTEIPYTALRDVHVEDLLPRDPIELDMTAIAESLTGKKILITGAAGSIGSEIVRQVAQYSPSELILIDQAETPMHDIWLMMQRRFPSIVTHRYVADICNHDRMENIFCTHKPDYVFHAAAYKHVPMMEVNPVESVQNNVYGTRVIADLAVQYETRKFVMISTDKAVNPTNVMGCSKRICEIYVQSLNRAIEAGTVNGVTQFVTTRFGNVLGSNGSVIPLFKEQIKAGGPLTVTHPDIIRYFMLIPEACKLVLEAGTMGQGGEIFVFDMGKPVRIADLAKRMILLSGARDIKIKYVGLRDGEKLYEELLSDAEQTCPTVHPKIRVAMVREYDYEQVCKQQERLLEIARHYNDMETVRMMKKIVPEFKSRHSRYEALDALIVARKETAEYSATAPTL